MNLNNIDNFGNIIISPAISDKYQNIYTSQNYDTFFGVFGKFKCDEENTGKVLGLDLKLITYKGLYNMEFVSSKIEKKFINEEGNFIKPPQNSNKEGVIHSPIYIVTIGIKAVTSNIPDDHISVSLDNINFDCITNDLFLFKKDLIALNGDTQEEFETRIDPNDNPDDILNHYQPYVNGMFDSEFYYRNGNIVKQRCANDNTIELSKDTVFDKDGSPSCRQRFSNIIVI